MPELTPRQRQVYDFIVDYIYQQGYPPTLREIGQQLQIRSTNGVNDHLRALERKGYLARDGVKSRALRPINDNQPRLESHSDDFACVPLVGRVAAGQPLLAAQHVETTVTIDRFFIGRNDGDGVFALRVTGDSMINDGIHDGDFIFVRKQLTANAGDVVVAMIEGEATVKRYFPEGDQIRLQPANDAMEPIVVRREEFRSIDLLGIVVGVYRRM